MQPGNFAPHNGFDGVRSGSVRGTRNYAPSLFHTLISSSSNVRELTGLSRPATNQLVLRLEETGFLGEITG